mgnify:CR=1 FL=1
MPMYEYECAECHAAFMRLRRMEQDDSDIVCPTCGSTDIQRQISVFATFSKDNSANLSLPLSGDGMCCSGGTCGCSAQN